MKKLRVLALMREGLVPPESLDGYSAEQIAEWKMEFDVVATLQDMGHEVTSIGIFDDLSPLRTAILEAPPDIVFMMLEEFHGVAVYDRAVVSYLELMRQHYTGCNAGGLMLTRDKSLSKKLMSFHRIPTPRFAVFPIGRKVKRPARLQFPILVKSTIEDASLGISQDSVVTGDKALVDRVDYIHAEIGSEAIAEEYIDGRELYVGILGNNRLQTFPVWEMLFANFPEGMARIATADVKWNPKFQKKHGIETRAVADLPPERLNAIARVCKRVYRALQMSGYGRIDLRMRDDGAFYVLEANANPNLSYGEDFAESAEAGGVKYEALLQRIINLGLRYRAAWQE